jgi:hypothetical protein
MKHLTVVYELPNDFDTRGITQHDRITAISWSHAIQARDAAEREVDRLLQVEMDRYGSGDWVERAMKAEAELDGLREQEPVAWMSQGKERLEWVRPDTVFGSHTIPLYTAPKPGERQ